MRCRQNQDRHEALKKMGDRWFYLGRRVLDFTKTLVGRRFADFFLRGYERGKSAIGVPPSLILGTPSCTIAVVFLPQ
ncbi:hypothetical protein SQ11_09180 [Nitrosospira sp. NpAV]|nr:hypothetical protein SQ11_09180 [Nitrosospira sp. NpAV]